MTKGGYIFHPTDQHAPRVNKELKELGMRQLYDEGSKSFSYLIWDKKTEDAIIIDPVRDQVSRDLVVCTNLNLVYAVNTHVHRDHISGTSSLKRVVNGLKSVISKKSGADADEYVEDGDEVHFGNRYVVAISTPCQTSSGWMSFLLDDGKAIIVNGFNKLFKLSDGSVILPGHDFDCGVLGDAFMARFKGSTMEEFVCFLKKTEVNNVTLVENGGIAAACNRKDGAKPFHVRSLRASAKQKWGIFG